MLAQPYLTFEGRAEEAIDFYVGALGAEVEMMLRFGEAPVQADPGGCAMPEGMPAPGPDKIMHASLRIGPTVVMLSDGMCQGGAEFKGFALSLTVKDAAEVERLCAVLGEGGTVQMPPAPTFFSPAFAMVADRFCLGWMLVAEQPA